MNRHSVDGLEDHVFAHLVLLPSSCSGDLVFNLIPPQPVANHLVFANVFGEKLESIGDLAPRYLCQMAAAEQVGLSDKTRGYAECVDGGIELCVRAGHEVFLQPSAKVRPDGRERRVTRNRGSVDANWEMVNQFVSARGIRSFEQCHAPLKDHGRNPDVAIQNPYNVAARLSICPAEVPDLRIRPHIFLSVVQANINVWMAFNHRLDSRERGIIAGRDAEEDFKLVAGVIDEAGGAETQLEVGVGPFYGPEDGDEGKLGSRKERRRGGRTASPSKGSKAVECEAQSESRTGDV